MHAQFKGRCACVCNELQAVGLFLAFDGTSTRTDPFTSGKRYRKSVNNAVFMRNKSLSLFQQRLRVYSNYSTRLSCYAAYALGAIEYALSNVGKYKSCWSVGNTMGVYMRYTINIHIGSCHKVL